MRSGEYRLRKQVGGVGHYAVVVVHVEDTTSGPEIIFSGEEFAWLKNVYGRDAREWAACDEYRAGALKGIQYALDHMPESFDINNVRIVVDELHCTLVDTTDISVAFAACFATWAALEIEGFPQPRIENGKFIFPES